MKNVLVTSIGNKVPLLNAVKNAMNKSGDFDQLYGSDILKEALGQYVVDQFWLSPASSSWTSDSLIEYCLQNQIVAIIPTRNGELGFFTKHADALLKKGIHTMISLEKTINTCLNKELFARELIEHGFLAIPTSTSIDNIKASSYVVKECFGAGSINLGLNLTREEALKHSRNLLNPVFQPYISGKEWSVDLYCSNDGDVHGTVARTRDVVIKGESQVTTTALSPALEKLCAEVARLLQIRGHAIFQVLEDKEEVLHIIECNPRFGGASTASIAVGLDSFFWFLQEAAGKEISPFLRGEDIRQVRVPSDMIIKRKDAKSLTG